MIKNINLGVIGIDHGHIFDMLDEMLKEGCTCNYFWTEGSPLTLKEFNQKYPNIKRVENKSEILNDNKIDMILISSIPKDRAINSIEALKSGKDVMVDKPGCTTLDQLEDLKRTVKETGKIWSVNFSERFHVAAVAKAEQLVAEGKIGKVKQTMGTGPHRQGNYERPNWFYERESYGGIITDIGSHQIHQFLVFTNSNEAKITHSIVENTTKKEFPGFQDFGEINLTGNGGHGYIRLDWFTPDALPTWGDGRLFILGDKGFIEIRKYIDLAKSDSGNHLYYANNEEVKHLDCRDVKLPYFRNLINDVLNRTETACSQKLTYLTMELAIKAQEIAEKKMSKYQVAIIGTNIGAKHYEDFQKVSDRFNVHTICGLTAEPVENILPANSDTKISLNFEEVLKIKEIDIVDICLPPHLHFSACKQSLEAGKHVICEKPLVSSLEELDKLQQISKETGKTIFPIFQYRYGPGFSKLKALIKSGLAGKPLVASLDTHWNRGEEYYSKAWRGTWKGEQGGAILSHSIHIHDLISMIFGPVSNVFAKLTTRVNDIEVEDCAALSVEMKNGALVTSSITLGAAEDVSRIKICFSNLTVESGGSPDKPYNPADDTWKFLAREPLTQNQVDEVLSNVQLTKSWYAGIFDEIGKKLDGYTSDEVTLSDARGSLEFVTAVYDSSRQEKNIYLPISKDNPLYKSWVPETK